MKIYFEIEEGEQTITIQIVEIDIRNQIRFCVNGWKVEEKYILAGIVLLFGIPCMETISKNGSFFAWETEDTKNGEKEVVRKILKTSNLCKALAEME